MSALLVPLAGRPWTLVFVLLALALVALVAGLVALARGRRTPGRTP